MLLLELRGPAIDPISAKTLPSTAPTNRACTSRRRRSCAGEASSRCLEGPSPDDPAAGVSSEAALYLIDANSADPEGADETAVRLRRTHPAGCAAFIPGRVE